MAMAPRNGVPVSDIVVFRPPRRNPTSATNAKRSNTFVWGVDFWSMSGSQKLAVD